jgi:hypothetical protein
VSKYRTLPYAGLDDREKEMAFTAVKNLSTAPAFTRGVVEMLRKRLQHHHDQFAAAGSGEWANYHGRVQELLDILDFLDPPDKK